MIGYPYRALTAINVFQFEFANVKNRIQLSRIDTAIAIPNIHDLLVNGPSPAQEADIQRLYSLSSGTGQTAKWSDLIPDDRFVRRLRTA